MLVCAWCGDELDPAVAPGLPAGRCSHGICERCFRRLADKEAGTDEDVEPTVAAS